MRLQIDLDVVAAAEYGTVRDLQVEGHIKTRQQAHDLLDTVLDAFKWEEEKQ